MAVGDVLSGFAQAGHEYQTNLIQMAYRQRDQLAGAYGKLMQDPSYPEEARAQFGQAFQDIVTADPFKLPQTIKKYKDMQISVSPPAGPPVSQNLSEPMGTPGAPMGQNVPNIPPPQPPSQTQSLFAPLSFEEQLRRQTAEEKAKFETVTKPSELLKLWQPKATGVKGVEVDKDGNAYQTVQQRYLDPTDTSGSPDGTWKTFDQKGGTPLRKFAPRASGELNIEDAIKLQEADPSQVFRYEGSNQPIDLQAIAKAEPDATLRHTGSGQYQINSQRYKNANIGGLVTPVPQIPPSGGPTASNIGAPLGPSQVGTTIERTGILPGVTNAQGEPMQGTTTTQRTPNISGSFTGQAPGATPVAPPAAAPSGVAPQAPPVRPHGSVSGIKNLSTVPGAMTSTQLNQQRGIVVPIQEVAASLIGDPNDPSKPSLESYGRYALDPKARTDIGAAIDMILHGAADTGLGMGFLHSIPLAGDALEWLRRQGVTQKMSEAQVNSIQRVLNDPKESQVVNQVIATYGVIPGLRVATKGSAYQFYVKNLENEIPTFGNLTSGGQFYQKLAILMRDVVNATSKGVSSNLLPDEQKQSYKDAETRLFKLSRLSDPELRTVHVDGPDIQYLKGGTGPSVTLEGSVPTPPPRRP